MPPTGRWAIELNAQRRVIGGVVLLYLPPGNRTWRSAGRSPERLGPRPRGRSRPHRRALGSGHPGVEERLAVARPANTRGAATAKGIGIEWVGETDKYYDLRLWVYRLRAADLDHPLPGDQHVDQHHQADSPASWRTVRNDASTTNHLKRTQLTDGELDGHP